MVSERLADVVVIFDLFAICSNVFVRLESMFCADSSIGAIKVIFDILLLWSLCASSSCFLMTPIKVLAAVGSNVILRPPENKVYRWPLLIEFIFTLCIELSPSVANETLSFFYVVWQPKLAVSIRLTASSITSSLPESLFSGEISQSTDILTF